MSWYFVDPDGGTKGPMAISQLKPLYGNQITDTTYLWNGINIHQWTELNKVPSLHKQLSGTKIKMQTQMHNINSNHITTHGLTPDDIDDILDEIDVQNQSSESSTNSNTNSNDQKQYEMTQTQTQIVNKQSKPNHNNNNNNKNHNSDTNNNKYKINWREIYLHRQSILNLVEEGDIDINVQNPSDGMTLLMHSIIIGDYNLCVIIINYGADMFIKDNDGDDALDYALVFQRYKVTQLLLVLGFMGGKNKNINIRDAIAYKNKQAKYMMDAQFGRLKDKIVQFVIKAIKERQSFDINLLYFAWYFTVHRKDNNHNTNNYNSRNKRRNNHKKIIKYNPYMDPLQSKLFKIMMKTYWEIISNKSSDKKGWVWLRKHFINSLIWYLPHPDNMHMNNNNNNNIETDDSDTSVSDETNTNIKSIMSQIDDSSDQMLFFLFL